MSSHAEQDFAAFTATATPELDADTRAVLDIMNAEGAAGIASMSPGESRAWSARMVARFALSPKPGVGEIEERTIPRLGEDGVSLPVRIYRPAGTRDPGGGPGGPASTDVAPLPLTARLFAVGLVLCYLRLRFRTLALPIVARLALGVLAGGFLIL